MPTPRLVQISAWSYSRLSCYNQCPRKAKYQCIDKLKEPDSPSGMNGTRVHAIAAMMATGKLPARDKDNAAFYDTLTPILKARAFPAELETFKDEFRALRKLKPIVEAQWAFDRAWQLADWFARDCWLRIKVDLHYVKQVKEGKLHRTQVMIVDHKTGKWSADHALQRELYALGAFLMYPDAQTVTAAHWYLDIGKEDIGVWQRAALPGLQKEWVNKTTAMLNDTTFAPTPSDKCRWCAFSAAKPCPACAGRGNGCNVCGGDGKGPCEF